MLVFAARARLPRTGRAVVLGGNREEYGRVVDEKRAPSDPAMMCLGDDQDVNVTVRKLSLHLSVASGDHHSKI